VPRRAPPTIINKGPEIEIDRARDAHTLYSLIELRTPLRFREAALFSIGSKHDDDALISRSVPIHVTRILSNNKRYE